MKSDAEIASEYSLESIFKIADKLGIDNEVLIPYGKYKAKLPISLIDSDKVKKSKLVLVSAISPTPEGEGKTTTSVGLNEGLNRIGKKSIVVLREPSLGPVFGMKGGATGGGYAQVVPMEDINLHFNGDFSAIEKANNLLSALIDNNIQNKKNSLGIDPRTIRWKRVMDMNDRALRDITIGLGGNANGVPRESSFDITAASEVMAILCLSESISELKERLGNIFIGLTFAGAPVFARDLKAHGAMATLLKDAINPNLVQTLEGNPAIIHGGPFANIAQGTNTILATKLGLSLSDIVVTEAGFGFDLGGEKFLDIKCRKAGLIPSAVVLVATIRALKYHGGMPLGELKNENLSYLEKGFVNLKKHLDNIKAFGLEPIVALNHFVYDTELEIKLVENYCNGLSVPFSVSKHWSDGGKGAEDLAKKVSEVIERDVASNLHYTYDLEDGIKSKIEQIATKIYGAKLVQYSSKAEADIKKIEKLGFSSFPVCIAKTQYSFTDDATKITHQEEFTITIREVELASGAGFIVPIAGEIMRMPGLPSTPAAESIDIDDNGNISGLF